MLTLVSDYDVGVRCEVSYVCMIELNCYNKKNKNNLFNKIWVLFNKTDRCLYCSIHVKGLARMVLIWSKSWYNTAQEWSKAVRMSNGLVFKWESYHHLKTRLLKRPVFQWFGYLNVQFLDLNWVKNTWIVVRLQWGLEFQTRSEFEWSLVVWTH